MLSTVKAAPNYYELLGVPVTATSDEIAQAFARNVSLFRPRPFGASADVCLAYATLYDAAKRRAYDASIGLVVEPEPKTPALTSVEVRYRREWTPAPFLAARPPRRVPDETPPAAPPSPAPPVQTAQKAAPAQMSIKEQVEQALALRGSASDPKPELVDWTRPGLTIATLLLAAAMIGAFAGLKSVEAIEPEQPARAAPVGAAAVTPKPLRAVEAPSVNTSQRTVAPEREAQTTERPRTPRERPAEALAAVPVESITESIAVVQSEAADTAVGDSAAEQVVAAALPISNKDVVRTIERIGYACGAVDSAVPVEGSGAGVFKVNCTSGHAYRAAPIRGRYHFRRWDRR